MSSMDLKRRKLELSRVSLAREELEFKIEEYKEQIARLSSTIQIQINKETELKAEIAALELKGE